MTYKQTLESIAINNIKNAVKNGHEVYWKNKSYSVIRDNVGQYLIKYKPNSNCIGLTDRAGKKLNGEILDFHIS